MRFLYTIFFLSVFTIHLFAQKSGETKMPLYGNFELSKHAAELEQNQVHLTPKISFGKQGIADSTFPFIEHFTNTGSLSQIIWADQFVNKTDQSATFDALDALGNVYAGGGFAKADMLTSKTIRLGAFVNNLYINFTFSTGNTWSSGDSLVLQILTSSGTWNSLWVSTNTTAVRQNITLPIDASLLDFNNVAIRFVNYTTLLVSNTEDYILHDVVFAHKIDLPLYENILTFSKDTFPSKIFWSRAKTVMKPGPSLGVSWANVAVFDSYDENRTVYNNANGANGFADTLESHFVDLTQFDISDSVFLRFYYRAMPNSKSADSLYLEMKNNVGVWIRYAAFEGSPFNNLKTFITPINFGKLRSSSFQFRLINKSTFLATDTLKWIATGFHIGKKLTLPFVDDFSATTFYPNQNLWKDKSVYINNHFPLHPPSFNVATFDGLDSRGNFYGYGRGYCDSLTSRPINLSGFLPSDSIYLSFYIEPIGNGDALANVTKDSLIVEMRNAAYDQSSFINKWGVVASNYPSNKFTQIFIKVDSAFLHDDFQFRFKNVGSKSGNLDHWHVDYVRLDKGRSAQDSSYNDYAVSAGSTSLIKTYSSMPWKHFISSQFQADTQIFSLRYNGVSNHAVGYSKKIYDPINTNYIDSSGNAVANFLGGTERIIQIKSSTLSLTNPGVDQYSMYFRTKASLEFSNVFVDNISSNDTFTTTTNFSNYFAYDDGSAEAGYGVKNVSGSVALGFTLSQADTFYGIQVFFNQSATDVTGRPFNFMLWKQVGTGASHDGELVIYRLPQLTGPIYTNKINGFAYIMFPPIPMSGKFYIGWEQTAAFELNVGLDQNYTINGQPGVNPEMYFKTSDLPMWQQTSLTGALMMRPIMGKWIDPPLAVKENKHQLSEISIYPNPANNIIHINADPTMKLKVELFDLTGRMILQQQNDVSEIVLPQMSNGMYVVKIQDMDSGSVTVKKVFINQ
ncbi:MAG: T9SS type A sorting domain-containing protein [Bacteroidota bacterium]